MTTLIERLRTNGTPLEIEAADEIVKLRIEMGRVYRQQAGDLDAASDAMEFAEKERDQLRAERDAEKRGHDNMVIYCDQARAERDVNALDAARYRFISVGFTPRELDMAGNYLWVCRVSPLKGPTLDAAFDEAMKGTPT